MKQQALTGPAWKGVYGAIRDHFHLSAVQRDRLDESPLYYRAMAFALSARTAASRLDYDAAETAWREVEATLTEICRCPAPPADTMTGHRVELEPRDPADPLCFPCCGGLRPAHTSRCRKS
jgi:hypothetical protein